MLDRQFGSSRLVLESVEREHRRQIVKWGAQARTPFEWMTYLTEEVGELAAAISAEQYWGGGREPAYNEAVHVATLALKIAEMYLLMGAQPGPAGPQP